MVKEGDDLMAATRYAMMMLRNATCVNDIGRLKSRDHFRAKHWGTGEGRNSWMSY